MSLSELDLAVALILVNPKFIAKNQKGKRMSATVSNSTDTLF